MQRRPLLASLALSPFASHAAVAPDFAALEHRVHGRLGFYAIDTGSGRTLAHRADERFATASTFKILLAARVAQGVDGGRWRWSDEVVLHEKDRVPHSPAFDRLLPRGRATLAELCAGIVIESDNPCANVLLRHCDGPAGLTAWLRAEGDDVTRLDRWETELNENAPGDARDTSTPRAFAATLQRLLLGQGLTRASQARLWADLQASRTGLARLRAGVPGADWRVLDKTGTGNRGAVNDVALVFPAQGRAPWVVAAFQSDSRASNDELSAVLAGAMRHLVKAWA